MSVGCGGRRWPPWIFIHDTVKVEEDLIVLFFGLVFSVSSPGKFSADALANRTNGDEFALVGICTFLMLNFARGSYIWLHILGCFIFSPFSKLNAFGSITNGILAKTTTCKFFGGHNVI